MAYILQKGTIQKSFRLLTLWYVVVGVCFWYTLGYASSSPLINAQELFVEAMDIVKDNKAKIGSLDDYLEVSIAVGGRCAEYGDRTKALAMLSDSSKMAKENNKLNYLANIADTYARLGESSKARAVLLDVLASASEIPDVLLKNVMISRAAVIYTKIGDYEQAKKLAFNLSGKNRWDVLREIFIQSHAHRTAENPIVTISDLLTDLQEIADINSKVLALVDMSKVYLMLGDSIHARVMVKEATDLAYKIEHPIRLRIEAFAQISRIYFSLHDKDSALKMLAQANQTLKDMDDMFDRAYPYLIEVVDGYMEMGKRDEALKTLIKIMELKVFDDDSRLSADIADRCVQLGDHVTAMNIAKDIPDNFWSANAFIKIANECISKKDLARVRSALSDALRIAHNMRDISRAIILAEIGCSYAHIE